MACLTKNSRLGNKKLKVLQRGGKYIISGKANTKTAEKTQCIYISEYLPNVSEKCLDIICRASFL